MLTIQTIYTALAYTGATLLVFTALHLFLWLIVWANHAALKKLAQHRRLGPIFLILFLKNSYTLRNHKTEISDFINHLEQQDREEGNRVCKN